VGATPVRVGRFGIRRFLADHLFLIEREAVL
jgi:hypothetical protein